MTASSSPTPTFYMIPDEAIDDNFDDGVSVTTRRALMADAASTFDGIFDDGVSVTEFRRRLPDRRFRVFTSAAPQMLAKETAEILEAARERGSNRTLVVEKLLTGSGRLCALDEAMHHGEEIPDDGRRVRAFILIPHGYVVMEARSGGLCLYTVPFEEARARSREALSSDAEDLRTCLLLVASDEVAAEFVRRENPDEAAAVPRYNEPIIITI